MQLFLYLFFPGSPWELANLVVSFLEKNNIMREEVEQDEKLITVCSQWFVAWISLKDNKGKFLEWLREDYQVVVNNHIYIQLYPGCDERMFSKFVAYLLANVEGDFYLYSEWDELILLRNHELRVEKERWKGYLGI